MIRRVAIKRTHRAAGFTLIEIMVALVVLAVATVAIYGRSGQAVSQLYSLEQRTLANWIAQDYMTRLRLQRRAEPDRFNAPMDIGSESEELWSAGRLWEIEVSVSDTELDTMKRVEVAVHTVSQEAGRSPPIVTTVGFLGQH